MTSAKVRAFWIHGRVSELKLSSIVGHWERLPYNNSAMRSIYHIREYNIRRLSLVRSLLLLLPTTYEHTFRSQLSSPSVFLSHDWPQSIEHHGDVRGLLKRKPFFKNDVNSGNLGSPPLMGLLRTITPQWWFSAHLHTRFEARVVHEQPAPSEEAPPKVANPDEIAIDDFDEDGAAEEKKADAGTGVEEKEAKAAAAPQNPDEITLDDEEDEVEAPPPPPKPVQLRETKFLALDKCLPRRQFLEVCFRVPRLCDHH